MSAADWKTPRTPWGDPDLQGVWSTAAEMSTPFERPASFGTRQWLTDEEFEQRLKQVNTPGGIFAGASTDPPSHWIERNDATRSTSVVIDPPDGRLPPISAEGRQRASAGPAPFGDGPFDGPEDASQWVRCITRGGLPGVMFPTVYNANARILQGPGYVAITYEMIHDTRVIPTDGRPPRRRGGAPLLRRFDRPLGRRHLRRGRHELQRQGHVPGIEPGAASHRALPAHRKGRRPLRSHGGRPGHVAEALDRGASTCAASPVGCSSTPARRATTR